MNEKNNRPQPKKILLYAILLAAFLVVTNPTLLPFLSPEAKQSIGSVWRSLFGDVDSIASVLVLNWATLFKLVAMVLLLILLTAIAGLILSHIHPRSGKARSAVTLLQSAVSYFAALIGIFWGAVHSRRGREHHFRQRRSVGASHRLRRGESGRRRGDGRFPRL